MTPSWGWEQTLAQHSEMNCPRRHTCWQSKKLYWAGAPWQRAAESGNPEGLLCHVAWSLGSSGDGVSFCVVSGSFEPLGPLSPWILFWLRVLPGSTCIAQPRWMPARRILEGWKDILATSCEELTHWKRLWCWEGLGAGGEGDDRGWDGWMASLTRWTWVLVNSGSWWWTGRPGVLRFMGLQRVGHDWATELNWIELAWFSEQTFTGWELYVWNCVGSLLVRLESFHGKFRWTLLFLCSQRYHMHSRCLYLNFFWMTVLKILIN